MNPYVVSTALSQECPYVPQNLLVLQRKPLDSNCSLNSKQANTFFHIRMEQRCWPWGRLKGSKSSQPHSSPTPPAQLPPRLPQSYPLFPAESSPHGIWTDCSQTCDERQHSPRALPVEACRLLAKWKLQRPLGLLPFVLLQAPWWMLFAQPA